ncbi:MAG: hypothetical protein U1E45_16920 [Geminicoccaceae bacterium]
MYLTAGGFLLALVLLLPHLAMAGGGTPPAVYRGDDGEMDTAAPPAADGGPAPPAQDETIVGGNRFWKVDPQSGKLLACRLVQTPNVGEQRIECAAGTLDQD